MSRLGQGAKLIPSSIAPPGAALKAGKPETIDEYLATLSEEKRAGLESLRRQIRAAEPELEECISYGIPSYRYKGKFIMSFGAAAKHLAFYTGAHPVDALKDK